MSIIFISSISVKLSNQLYTLYLSIYPFIHLIIYLPIYLSITRVSDPDPDPDPDPQDPHVFGLPGSGSGQKGKEMNE